MIAKELEQGERSRREWLKDLGFTRKERFTIFIVDAYAHMVEVPFGDDLADETAFITPSNSIILQRIAEIQEWASAVSEREKALNNHCLDLSDPDDLAFWDRATSNEDVVNDYSEDAFEIGTLPPVTS